MAARNKYQCDFCFQGSNLQHMLYAKFTRLTGKVRQWENATPTQGFRMRHAASRQSMEDGIVQSVVGGTWAGEKLGTCGSKLCELDDSKERDWVPSSIDVVCVGAIDDHKRTPRIINLLLRPWRIPLDEATRRLAR